jgi:hypothetical protein
LEKKAREKKKLSCAFSVFHINILKNLVVFLEEVYGTIKTTSLPKLFLSGSILHKGSSNLYAIYRNLARLSAVPTALYGEGKPPAISHPPNLATARFVVVRFAAHVTESNISDRTKLIL